MYCNNAEFIDSVKQFLEVKVKITTQPTLNQAPDHEVIAPSRCVHITQPPHPMRHVVMYTCCTWYISQALFCRRIVEKNFYKKKASLHIRQAELDYIG